MSFKYYEQAPASGGKAKSAVIFLHGVGSNGQDLIALAPPLAEALPDTAFVSPDAPFAYDAAPMAEAYQWFSLQNRNPDAMLEGARNAQAALDSFIDEIMRKYEITADKLALFGFSQGTMMALFAAPRRKDKLVGIVGCSGALLAPDLLADEAINKPDICLIHGEADDIVPFERMAQAEDKLKENGFSVESHARPYLPHSIDMQGVEFAKKFLSDRL